MDEDKLLGPSHFYGVRVPQQIRRTWEDDGAHWWREGTLETIATFRMDMDKAHVYGVTP